MLLVPIDAGTAHRLTFGIDLVETVSAPAHGVIEGEQLASFYFRRLGNFIASFSG
jgi:hypothetical protein